MSTKLNIAIVCGGQSAEHEVSLTSARNIIAALDSEKYNILTVLITKSGNWYLFDSTSAFLNCPEPQALIHTQICKEVTLPLNNEKAFICLNDKSKTYPVDVIFPVLHGTNGEDGTIQGLLELVNIPYVGAGVLASAVCMDKEISKILLNAANIPVTHWITVHKHEKDSLNFNEVVHKLGLPFFIKPANTGSSVGISKIKTEADFWDAVELALQYDRKILIESYVKGREIEFAVLGNEYPEVSLPGEIVPHAEFYTYEAKYLDPNGAELIFPAKLPLELMIQMQETAIKTYKTLNCEGMARIDFFLTEDNQFFVNEANTIPGFTQYSMYPKLWSVSGIAYSELLDKLIELALKRGERNQAIIKQKNFLMKEEAA